MRARNAGLAVIGAAALLAAAVVAAEAVYPAADGGKAAWWPALGLVSLALLVAAVATRPLRDVPWFAEYRTAVVGTIVLCWMFGLTALLSRTAWEEAFQPAETVPAVVTDCRILPGAGDMPEATTYTCRYYWTAKGTDRSQELDTDAVHPDGYRTTLRIDRATGNAHSGYGDAAFRSVWAVLLGAALLLLARLAFADLIRSRRR